MRVSYRKGLAKAVATIAAVAGLAACGGGGGTAAPDGTIALFTWVGSENDRAQWQEFVAAGQKSKPDLKVSIDGPNFEDYWTKVKTRLSGGDPPCLLTTQSARAQELAALLTPLDDLMATHNIKKTDFDPSMIEGMTVDGSVRAIPYDAEPIVVFYNVDKFTQAGLTPPGATYSRDRFVSDAKALTSGGKFGLGISPGLFPALAHASAGGSTWLANGQLDLTNPAFVNDMQWYFDLANVQKVGRSPEASTKSDEIHQSFINGDVAMITEGPWNYGDFAKAVPFQLGMTVVPSPSGAPRAMTAGSGFGIAANCADKDAAFAAIVAMTSVDALGTVAGSRGIVPSRAESLPAWSQGKTPSATAVIEASLGNAVAQRTTPTWNQVETLFTRYMSEGFTGQRTAADILRTIQGSVSGG
ncbi:ABC transporter substrate-binding protein [Pseudonocardia sp. TRM90224]|uniref:ABC transporter substrate-binding protein n=1 Tax=Pseudonocardia sp. TRM90224 TaxID=2812678 RepID=UPI001E34E5F5|nr:sugar ABC transporter substrate-binding protein [Pseudonocardia sp. TRM90224]